MDNLDYLIKKVEPIYKSNTRKQVKAGIKSASERSAEFGDGKSKEKDSKKGKSEFRRFFEQAKEDIER